MILTIANWIYAALIAGIVGFGFIVFLKKVTGYACKEIDVCILLGIALVTAYAEAFSLLYKVGGVANAVLVALCILIGIVCKKENKNLLYITYNKLISFKIKTFSKENIIRDLIVISVFIAFWLIACQRAYHADTDLYHAQAIRWIEEYGVAKGLGNLHHRLAFNSAFMVLQALFSWKFLIDQSMHVMNAYLCMLLTMHALFTCSWFKGKRVRGSDAFKVVMLLYDIMNVSVFASPNTDNFVLLFCLYILSKWCEYVEEKDKQPEAFGLLCILALYAVTVKLSVAMIMVLTLKPAIELLKKKRYKSIFFMIVTGLFILLPFSFRNFMISGYFLYPSVATGFFEVDWKMLPDSVKFDKQEIMARARGIYEVNRYSEACNMPFAEWFPIWWSQQEFWIQLMFVINIILVLVLIGINCRKIIKRYENYDIVINITVIVQFIYWMMTAPRNRYGIVFLFLIPCMVIVHLVETNKKIIIKFYSKFMPMAFGILAVSFIFKSGLNIEEIPLKRSSYYVYRECEEVEWEGMTMYTPIENNYTGYYYFPSITYEDRLKYLELRGETLKEGFRIKDEYKHVKIMTDGRPME